MEGFEEILKKFEQESAEYEKRKKPYIQALVDKLNIPKEKIEELGFNIDKIPYSPLEFASVVEYFIEVFNGFEKLCNFIKEQSIIDTMWDTSFRKNTIFTLKPYTQFGVRIKFLQGFFNVDHDECISLITQNPSWIYHKEQYFIDRSEAFADFFHLSKSETISFFKEYPFTLGKRISNLSSNVYDIALHYNVPITKVKELLLDYPGLMNRSLGYFLEFKIPKEVFDKHWLIRCITVQNDFSGFAGYRTFENLVHVIKKIEEEIGEIIDFYRKDYSDGSSFALLVRNAHSQFLVTLGSNTVSREQIIRLHDKTPEQKLLDAIFGSEPLKKEPYQEHFAHREFICELNDNGFKNIESIHHLLASISFHDARGTVTLNSKSNVFFLSNSGDIKPCSIAILPNLVNETNNLDVTFYKVEPIGDGKFKIAPLREQVKLDEPASFVYDDCDDSDILSLFEFDDEDLDLDSLFDDDDIDSDN